MRCGTAVAVLTLLVGAGACTDDAASGGAGGDAPSVREFCSALETFEGAVDAVDPAQDLPGYIAALKDAAGVLQDVGVPEEMPGDARNGFTITIERIEALSETATLDELSQLGDVPEDDQATLDALDDYITSACPDLGDQATP